MVWLVCSCGLNRKLVDSGSSCLDLANFLRGDARGHPNRGATGCGFTVGLLRARGKRGGAWWRPRSHHYSSPAISRGTILLVPPARGMTRGRNELSVQFATIYIIIYIQVSKKHYTVMSTVQS